LLRHRADSQRSCARLGALVLPLAPTPEETTAFLQPRGEFRAAITATAARLEARQAERKATPKKVALKELPAANASRSWVRRVNSLSIRSK
jgi:cob(I)alamin adenosyltransferase